MNLSTINRAASEVSARFTIWSFKAGSRGGKDSSFVTFKIRVIFEGIFGESIQSPRILDGNVKIFVPEELQLKQG